MIELDALLYEAWSIMGKGPVRILPGSGNRPAFRSADGNGGKEKGPRMAGTAGKFSPRYITF
jgi:hypothetical protein